MISGPALVGFHPQSDAERALLKHLPNIAGTDHEITVKFDGDSQIGVVSEVHSNGVKLLTIFTPQTLDDVMIAPEGEASYTHIDRVEPENSFAENYYLVDRPQASWTERLLIGLKKAIDSGPRVTPERELCSRS